MGFKYDFTNQPTDEERWRDLLARLEAEFAAVKDPAVHSRDDEAPGMLLMIERCIDSGYYDLAASIVGDLRGGKAQRLGALATAKLCPAWHVRAKPIWMRNQHLSRRSCAKLIIKELKNLAVGERQVMRAIKKWEEEGSAK